MDMKAKKKRIRNFLWLFLYIYNILFAGLPAMLRTRMIIGGWGVVAQAFRNRQYWSRIFTTIIGLNLLFVACSIITAAVNGHYDFWFTQYAALCCLYLFGGIYVAYQFKAKAYSFNDFLYFIAWVILIHTIIAITAYSIKPLGTWVHSIQSYGSSAEAMASVLKYHSRAIGFGIGAFFVGGYICGLGAIIFAYLTHIAYIKPVKGGLLIILSVVLGMFIARTSMFGLLGLLLFVKPGGIEWNKIVKIVFVSVLTVGVLYIIYIQFLSEYFSLNWAFELFINFLENDEAATKSTNELQTMWRFPDSAKTWLIGDGLFFDRRGYYYMHTDVGYLRIIFDIGLLGLAVFFVNQGYLVYAMWKLAGRDSTVLKLGVVLFIFILILNVKGFAELNFFYYLTIPFLYNRGVNLRQLNGHR